MDLKEGNKVFVMTNTKSLRHGSEFACVGKGGSLSPWSLFSNIKINMLYI